jgi:hypothetical protein
VSQSLDFVFRVFEVVVGLWFVWAGSFCGGPVVEALNKATRQALWLHQNLLLMLLSPRVAAVAAATCHPVCERYPSARVSWATYVAISLPVLCLPDQAGMVLLGLS